MKQNDDYNIAYSQVLEILKYLPVNYYEKIPERMINMFKANMKLDYNFNYDPNKSLEEQEVNKKAIEILSIINEKYISNT